MSTNTSNNAVSTNVNMPTNAPYQELLDSLRSAWEEQQELERLQEEEIFEDEHRYREYVRQEEEKKQNAILLGPPPVLRRETPEDYILDTPPILVRQDTLVLPPSPPVLRRETPEDYLFDPNSFISPDRLPNIQMPGTPVANRTSLRDLSNIRPRRLNFN